MIRRPFRSALWAVIPALVLAGCADGENSSAASGSNVTSDLLRSKETVAEDQQAQMSRLTGAAAGFGTWLNENVPTTPVDIDTLGFKLGDPDAPVQIIEFSDYGCSYCRKFHLEIFPGLERDFVDSGKIYWHYVPMLLGIFPNAIEAGMVAECAAVEGADRRALTDLLFDRQSQWKSGAQPMEVLYGIAETTGVDMDAVRACVAEQRRAPALAAGSAFASTNGVRGTPTFFILDYGAIPGAIPEELFREVLDTAYAEITRGDGPAGGQ